MQQKHFATGTDLPSPNENISVPIGSVKVVEHYLGSVGILDFVDTFKEKGVPMSRILVAMCTYILQGNNSMKGCARWLSDPNVGKEIGLEEGLSQRTINRAVKDPFLHKGIQRQHFRPRAIQGYASGHLLHDP